MMPQTRFEICFVTAGRMDFGLISPILKEMTTRYADIFSPKIIAMGAHASEFHGGHTTVIDAQEFKIHTLLETLYPEDDAHGVAKSFANTADKISTVFKNNAFDLLIIPGDRYEMLACASIATVMGIPIAHLYGGDITYGAYDDSLRHAITKLSHIHFVSNEESKKRVIQMGENPELVFNYGAPSLSHLDNPEFMTRSQLEEELDITFNTRNLLFTYHPVTRATSESENEIEVILNALDQLADDTTVFFTMPNTDNHGTALFNKIQNYVSENPRHKIFKALGTKRYLGMLNAVDMVVGNSSSGLYEAPSFGIPTINIGERQKGRLAAKSVIHCPCDTAKITEAIHKALDMDCSATQNPYYKPHSANAITQKLKDLAPYKKFIQKEFTQ